MQYNQIYQMNNVWGKEPNELLQKVFCQFNHDGYFLDLGCGPEPHQHGVVKVIAQKK